MGDNESSPEIDNLCSCFDQAFKLMNELDKSDLPTNDVNFQKKVTQSINLLERSTEMVNQLNLFSINETIEDVPNSSIKYLLLPSLLGYLHTKLTGKDRMECLKISDIYFKDYLKRIKSYEVCPIGIDLDELEDDEDNDCDNNTERAVEKVNVNRKGMSSIAELQAMGKERQAKIENYRRLKEVQEKLETIEGLLDKDETTDEQKREYYILLIKKWVSTAIEEIHGIKKEKEILKMVGPKGRKKLEPTDKIKSEPLKPFIITRTELQKKVFGLGYPSVPTMSIEAFIESKIQEGSLSETKPGQSNSLMDWAQNPDLKKQQDEDDAATKEKADDTEDPDALRKARGWDEFKDDNKRGWGNRYNRS